MPSRGVLIFFICGMLVCGASNSLWSKYQDMQCVKDCDTDHPKLFEQPVWQTLTMFLGESLCMLALWAYQPFKRSSDKSSGKYSKLSADDVANNASTITLREPLQKGGSIKFLVPALFDICGTTLMNVGLLFTPVSVYQMCRGALVLWVGLFSVLFLKRRLAQSQWASLLIVMLGVCIVGLAGASHVQDSKGEAPGENVEHALVGLAFILVAQVFTASQFVAEEMIMERYSVEPLRAVGMEGVFGTIATLILMPIAYFAFGKTPKGQGGYFDVPDGWHEIISNNVILWTSILIALSIAFFNGFGLAVTKSISATARSLIDTCRTVVIWAVSLALGWESLKGLQLVGFALLVYGTLVFNDVIALPSFLGLSNVPYVPEVDETPTIEETERTALLAPSSPESEYTASVRRGRSRTRPPVARNGTEGKPGLKRVNSIGRTSLSDR